MGLHTMPVHPHLIFHMLSGNMRAFLHPWPLAVGALTSERLEVELQLLNTRYYILRTNRIPLSRIWSHTLPHPTTEFLSLRDLRRAHIPTECPSLRDLRRAHIPPRLRRGEAKHKKRTGARVNSAPASFVLCGERGL